MSYRKHPIFFPGIVKIDMQIIHDFTEKTNLYVFSNVLFQSTDFSHFFWFAGYIVAVPCFLAPSGVRLS